jgi:hypothetical protein
MSHPQADSTNLTWQQVLAEGKERPFKDPGPIPAHMITQFRPFGSTIRVAEETLLFPYGVSFTRTKLLEHVVSVRYA